MFKSLLLRLIRSRRVIFAISSNGLISLSNFVISISIARSSSISSFAEFSFAMVSYLFITGLIRSAYTNTSLSRPDDVESFTRSLQRSSLSSVFLSIALALLGIATSNNFILLLAFTLHGLILLDYLRTFNSAAGKIDRPFITTIIWSCISIPVSICSFFTHIDPLAIFAVWCISGSLIGYAWAFLSRTNFLPIWKKNADDTKNAAVFTADYLVGAGGSQLTTGFLGFLNDPGVLGAIRGSGTLLGPVNLISTTSRSLMLPFLARDQNQPKQQFKSAIAAILIQVSAVAPILLAFQFIPNEIGEQLLGDTWKLASLALLPMSIDALFNIIMSPAISGHRVAFAGARSLSLRLFVGLTRPFIVIYCAQNWGITGATWAMAAISVSGSLLWWLSYHDLCRRASRRLDKGTDPRIVDTGI